MAVQDYPGAAEELSLSAGINDSVTAFSVAQTPTASWPTGSDGAFVVVIDPGVSGKEEKVKITTRSGSSFSTVERGYDDTTAAAHSTGAVVRASIDAHSFVRANKAVVNTIEKWTTAAQILVSTAAETGAAVSVSGDATLSGAGVLSLGNDVVDSAEIVAGAVDLEHMSANSVDSDQYVDGSIDRVHLAADIVDGTKIADDSIDSEHYVDGSIDTAHLGDLQVTAAKVAADVATQAELDAHAADASTHGITNFAVIPLGVLGLATRTTPQTGISSETDLTGLSVTFTPEASRRVRLSAYVPVQQLTSASFPVLRIKEGATQLQQANLALGISATAHFSTFVIVEPTAAEHTYKLTLTTGAGTVGTIVDDSPVYSAYLLAEDIGSA